MKRIIFGVFVVTSVLLVPLSARGQSSTTGAIAGVARDTTGAVLPGVTVEAASPALIEKVRSVVTDANGNYKIIDLRPGIYTVTFTLPGFSTYKREGLELNTGVTVPTNAEMKVGGLQESITVSGASPVIDVQNTRNQNVLKQEVLEALPAGRTNAGFAELTLGAASVTGGASVVDQGGSKGDSSQRLTVHGLRAFDQRIYYDGAYQQNLLVSGKNWQTNQMAVQEVVMGTATGSAEVETSGMQINFIPKDGGNSFRGTINGAGTTHSLQANNIDDKITATGVTSGQSVKSIYDFGVGIGGPITKDKLWFYTAHRFWGSKEYQPDAYFNKSTSPFVYVPDLSRQAYADTHARDYGVRLTWQAAAKHKINIDYHLQDSCQCYLTINSLLSPEAATFVRTYPAQQTIVTWNNPVSSRLFLEAGVSFYNLTYKNTDPEPVQFPDAVRISDGSTGRVFAALGGGLNSMRGDSQQPNIHQRASASYVIGSHAFKVGDMWMDGFYHYYQEVNQSLWYNYLAGRPSSLVQWAMPVRWFDRIRNIGVYAQDQWTMKRLTLNLGARYDSFQGWVPAGSRQASPFTPAFSFDRVDNVPNLKDISPRIGAAWDVFGDGKTAIKGAIGRYVGAIGVDFQDPNNNPALAIVTSVTRTWADANSDNAPNCVLTNLLANGECGQVNNLAFGQPFRNTFYDPSVTEGTGKRAYSWQGNIALQQQLVPGVGVNVGYFRTQYANFGLTGGVAAFTQNTLVTASDFSTYCVTSPVDARLPGGGGKQICGFYDVSVARFGQVRNLVTSAAQFGEQKEQYDGIDLQVNARVSKAFLTAGVSLGRLQTDNCYQNARPDIAAQGNVGANPRNMDYCHVVPPWSAGTQVKANGFYPLPWFGLEPSFTFQNLPGAQVLANRSTPNAEIAPSLGRNLASCGAAATCPGTATLGLIAPQTMFLDRVSTLNLGLAKMLKIGKGRVKGTFDLYNVFNASTVLNVNTTYGPSWLRPTSIIGGRLAKFSAQFDF